MNHKCHIIAAICFALELSAAQYTFAKAPADLKQSIQRTFPSFSEIQYAATIQVAIPENLMAQQRKKNIERGLSFTEFPSQRDRQIKSITRNGKFYYQDALYPVRSAQSSANPPDALMDNSYFWNGTTSYQVDDVNKVVSVQAANIEPDNKDFRTLDNLLSIDGMSYAEYIDLNSSKYTGSSNADGCVLHEFSIPLVLNQSFLEENRSRLQASEEMEKRTASGEEMYLGKKTLFFGIDPGKNVLVSIIRKEIGADDKEQVAETIEFSDHVEMSTGFFFPSRIRRVDRNGIIEDWLITDVKSDTTEVADDFFTPHPPESFLIHDKNINVVYEQKSVLADADITGVAANLALQTNTQSNAAHDEPSGSIDRTTDVAHPLSDNNPNDSIQDSMGEHWFKKYYIIVDIPVLLIFSLVWLYYKRRNATKSK